jgi:hypothetical protein
MTEIMELPPQPTLEQIQAFERVLRKFPQVDCPVDHFFADGLYGRLVLIPAGTTVTGKMHAGRHLNVLLAGTIKVTTEQGVIELTAPHVMVSEAGVKRVGHAYTDTLWLTVHASDKTDIAELERELIIPEHPALEGEDS